MILFHSLIKACFKSVSDEILFSQSHKCSIGLISGNCEGAFKCAGVLYAIHKYNYMNERNGKKRLEFAQSYVKNTDGVLEQSHLHG